MCDIYQDIRELLFRPHINFLSIYGDHRTKIEGFLANPSNDNAKRLFTFIGEIQQKSSIYHVLEILELYEKQFKEILSNHRDHYKHSANVYLLGLALYNSNAVLRNNLKTCRHAPDDDANQKQSFLFRWSLASVLHDLCYPLQMSVEAFNDYSSFLHNEKKRKDLIINPNIICKFNNISVLDGNDVSEHMRKNTSIGLITNYLSSNIVTGRTSSISYEDLYTFLTHKIERDLINGEFDHGIFSALITIKYINELYRKNVSWNRKDFYYEVVDSATAIFLHNFFKYSGIKDLLNCNTFQCSYPNPLGYLLCLCDTFCEWNRENNTDHREYRLTVPNQNEIDFKVPANKRNEIRNTVEFLNEELTINIR